MAVDIWTSAVWVPEVLVWPVLSNTPNHRGDSLLLKIWPIPALPQDTNHQHTKADMVSPRPRCDRHHRGSHAKTMMQSWI